MQIAGNTDDIEFNINEIVGAIERLQKISEIFSNSELNEKTIVWLISKASGVSAGQTREVLHSLHNLEEKFLETKA